MITEDQRREIRRLFYAEHWRIGTIVKNCGYHADTVRRAIGTETFHGPKHRDQQLDPYRPFITQTVGEYPKIRATRLHQMILSRGYEGSVYPVRRMIAEIRPRVLRAFQDLYFLPGEMAQIDWATFGKIQVGARTRPLMAFVMVLAYSRMIYAKMFYDQKTARVLEGHCGAFDFFGGVPRICLYDNMKTAVIENCGDGIRFNSDLNRLAGHYRFRPRACSPRSGWEKGRVERAIRYIRDNFLEARCYRDIEDLNRQLDEWLRSVPPDRSWPDDSNKTVAEVFLEEKLLALPGDPYQVYEEKPVVASKKSFIHFDANRYSLPPEGAAKKLLVRATHDQVVVFDGTKRLCEHKRSWSRKEKIVDPDHQQQIIDQSRLRSRRGTRNLLAARLPGVGEQLLQLWSELDESLAGSIRKTLDLIDLYGTEAVRAAAAEAIARKTPRADSIRFLLAQGKEPAPKDAVKPRLRPDLASIEVKPHDLSTYDDLGANHDDK